VTGRILEFLGATKRELGPIADPRTVSGWSLETDEDGIAWLVLNRKESGANTIDANVLGELKACLVRVEKDRPKALVIRSGKPDGFIAGADIAQFRNNRGAEVDSAVEEQLNAGHQVLDRLEKLRCPTIAVVHGYALGAGFELALACDHRIAIDGAWFGFPEVRLGLHPGLGGTFRLPALIDPIEAITMMLTGKSAYTEKAIRLGIVDLVTQERHLRNAVRSLAENRERSSEWSLKRQAFNFETARTVAARSMRARSATIAPEEHYPAPYALIDLWEEHGDSRQAMQDQEIRSFAKLLKTDTAQNLIRAFFLREQLKGMAGSGNELRRIHVVGAGAMGAEIAAWCAIKGLDVTLFDVDRPALAKAVQRAARLCDSEHLSAIERGTALDRLVPDPKGQGVPGADLVIEAAPENFELKQKIYREIEPKLKQSAIIATNTSSLPVQRLASVLQHPQRFAGLHFFNPVSKLELVEVVAHDAADKRTLTRLRNFTGAIARLPAPVSDYPGFLVNRALTPYLLEAIILIDEGVDRALIDRAAEKFGMPVGPVELADRVGLDICLHVAQSLRENLPEADFPATPAWLREQVERGELGEKTGKGLYPWKDGEPQKEKIEKEPAIELQDRLILPMLDACMECLRKKVVANADIIDAALIFGAGFAPFRGGPMHYARGRGFDEIRAELQRLAERHGDRFAPDPGWSKSR
jgi:3-hydroxyacyl-CoA dehydrogenase / enoyl-CoA hydratase / 3-hydroxybutyryl-CoA epimerase